MWVVWEGGDDASREAALTTLTHCCVAPALEFAIAAAT